MQQPLVRYAVSTTVVAGRLDLSRPRWNHGRHRCEQLRTRSTEWCTRRNTLRSHTNVLRKPCAVLPGCWIDSHRCNSALEGDARPASDTVGVDQPECWVVCMAHEQSPHWLVPTLYRNTDHRRAASFCPDQRCQPCVLLRMLHLVVKHSRLSLDPAG